ncbi:MAG: hypothetical protein JWL61_5002 [Gemmatimonadetes bacterium]|nr:hypothetical protein [Gemmatimonadota bacterium]
MGNVSQHSFSSGEVSPALYARTDLGKYSTGLRTCRNFIVRKQGGLDNRPGTGYAGPTSASVRMLPFVFNDAQTCLLVFTNLSVAFVRNGAFIAYSLATPYLAADLSALQITQSADVVTIVHPSYPPATLSRFSDTNWVYAAISFAPSIAAPAGFALTPAASGGVFHRWVVTSLGSNGAESYPTAVLGVTSVEVPQARTLSWTPVAGAVGYNIYAAYYGNSFGLVGTAVDPSFYDGGLTPDLFNQPPAARSLFDAAGEYPSAANYYQGRQLFGGPNLLPGTIYTSRSADYQNFTVSVPTQDDDAITFGLVSKKVQQVRHIVDASSLLVLTSGGEWIIGGDSSGVLRPTDINALQFSQHGSSLLPPILIDHRVIYVQARQTIVRDIARNPNTGYSGNDLTIISGHLFEGHTIVDWCYQESASVIWCVRDDGVLLGLTTVDEQNILAWHRHDTLGTVVGICCIPEGSEDRVYLAVTRNGATGIERMHSRFFTDIEDAVFLDSSLTYDGRNTGSTTMTLSGGTDWTFDELLTCTASASTFTAGDVGNAVFLDFPDGTQIRFAIAGYTSGSIVTGFPQMTVPAADRGIATTDWARAVDVVSGLDHLEGLSLGVFADGYVVASPNNPQVTTECIVSGGSITLDRPHAYIHAGLPFVSDMGLLDLDTPEGQSMRDKTLLINRVTLEVNATRGVFAGGSEPADDGTSGLFELKLRDTEDYSTPVSQVVGAIKQAVQNNWDQRINGRVFVRQVDPVPLTILAVIPSGNIPPAATR